MDSQIQQDPFRFEGSVVKLVPPPSPTTTLFGLLNIFNPLNLKVLTLQYVNEIIVLYRYCPYSIPTLHHPYGVPTASLSYTYSIPIASLGSVFTPYILSMLPSLTLQCSEPFIHYPYILLILSLHYTYIFLTASLHHPYSVPIASLHYPYGVPTASTAS